MRDKLSVASAAEVAAAVASAVASADAASEVAVAWRRAAAAETWDWLLSEVYQLLMRLIILAAY